jgi:hypothetical protein
VALKALPEEFVDDAERVARFQRESAISGFAQPLRHSFHLRLEDSNSTLIRFHGLGGISA